MIINDKKTVCMIFQPVCRSKALQCEFPKFQLSGTEIQYVHTFRYLGHLINDNATDTDDIQREIRNLFIRTNVLVRKFHRCSLAVKIRLFKTFCLCFYGVGLWSSFTMSCINKLKSA